jgi:hypothetical protein
MPGVESHLVVMLIFLESIYSARKRTSYEGGSFQFPFETFFLSLILLPFLAESALDTIQVNCSIGKRN